ncbi:MAG: S8 family serine peptidase [Planctomycetota bacterium]
MKLRFPQFGTAPTAKNSPNRRSRKRRNLRCQVLEERRLMDADDSFSEANSLGSLLNDSVLTVENGYLHRIHDVDMYSFRAQEGQEVVVELDGRTSGAQQRIRLFSPDVAYDNVELLTTVSDGSLHFRALETATYYVGVSEASNEIYNPATGGWDILRNGARPGRYDLTIIGEEVNAEPEIVITHGGTNLVDGDRTPTTREGTDFGSATRGDDPVARTFLIHNDGDADLILDNAYAPNGFQISHNGQQVTAYTTLTILPGDSRYVRVEMATDVEGIKEGTLRFRTNDSDENPFDVTIRGEVTASQPPPPIGPVDSVGLFNPFDSEFDLRDDLDSSSSNQFRFGPSNQDYIPLVGDWDGDGQDSVGLYDPVRSVFHLKNGNSSGSSDIYFSFGPQGNSGWTPLAGDWDGDGVDTIGFYQPDLSLFHLKDSFTAGASDQYFGFGPAGNRGWTPLVGDWNGDGVDTVGFYESDNALFHLKDSFTHGPSDQYFVFGARDTNWDPMAGDWNGDGVDTIGLFEPGASRFHLKDSFTPGPSDHYVRQTTSAWSVMPLSGNWNPGDAINDPPGPTPTNPIPLPEVPNYGRSTDWNLNAIGAPEAWAAGYTGQGVTVAVIDSGIDYFHSDLADNTWRNPDEGFNDRDDDGNTLVDDLIGWDFVSDDALPEDGSGHGTHVSGTIAALRNGVGATGVAPDATIMPLRVLDNEGNGYVRDSELAIYYAVDEGAQIINLSLSADFTQGMVDAVRYAARRDVLIVAASGNDGADVPSYPAVLSAMFPNVISVGAYRQSSVTDAMFRAYFSNQVGNSGAVQVDAPGVSIYSTTPNSRFGSNQGTSMAAPHVSGVAALALSANPNLTASQLRDLIVGGATEKAIGSDSIGMVDARTTVAYAAAGWTTVSATVNSASASRVDNTDAAIEALLGQPSPIDGILKAADVESIATSFESDSHRTGTFTKSLELEQSSASHDTPAHAAVDQFFADQLV